MSPSTNLRMERGDSMNAQYASTGTTSRRQVLQAGLGWAAASVVPAMARAATADRSSDRTLVLLHLSGGNDGLNTLIPYADPLYHEARPRLSRVARRVLPINEQLGFHPALVGLQTLYRKGRLAIVQGVGFSTPDYSHVGACRVWASAGPSLQRALQPALPIRIVPRVSPAGPAPLEYMPGQVADVLADVLGKLRAPHPPAVITAAVGGFDTHEDQLDAHEQVLRELGDGLAWFQGQLAERNIADRVVLVAWSEFGRRIVENAMGGTDHGSAGPLLVVGQNIGPGVFGCAPSLKDTDFGNLVASVDLRSAGGMGIMNV